MRNSIFMFVALAALTITPSAYSQSLDNFRVGDITVEYYYPGMGWYNPSIPKGYYTLGTYQYYGSGSFGNNYFGPTPWQRTHGYDYGVYNNVPNNIRYRVGPIHGERKR